MTVTRWGLRSVTARSQIDSKSAISRSRPTIGALVTGRSAGAESGATASQAGTGSRFPFATTEASSS